ncbi:MAG: flagellar filament capping protein FliD [Deltaproteobacteria bacterium]|nr:flagellar filament capping protein FliD [Deltaproteobacteria bacterium]
MADTSGITYQSYMTPNTNFSSLSGSINFTGLGSGTDFNEIIDQLVEIESINKTRLEYWRSSWEAKIESMQSLNQRLEAVEEAAGAMDTKAEFLSKAAATSNTGVAYATPTSEATTGAYQVEVGTDVKQILRSVGWASAATADIAGSAGTLDFDIDGTSYSVAVDATDTLTTLAGKINTAVGSDVAEVINDGTGSRPYHLQITSNVGGADGRLTVTKNNTYLSLDEKDVFLRDDTGWTGPSLGVVGQFTGDKATASIYDYDFEVVNGGTVGTDVIDLRWRVNGGAWNDFSLPADYQAGSSVAIEEGFSMQFGTGTFTNGETFAVRGVANDLDDAELTDWGGPAVSTGGNYQGYENKTYTFRVATGGAIQAGGGADTIVLSWTNSAGKTGTVSIDDSDLYYEVEQGIKIKIDAGTLTKEDQFQINAFAPTLQQGQDKGLASATKVVHSGFVDTAVTPVTSVAGTFSYTYNGQAYNVAVDAGTTLSQLVKAINQDSLNPGVTASIINDGMGLPDSYKLVLTGNTAGASYQITNVTHDFDNDAFGTGGNLGGGFTRSQYATNSMIKVDGFPADADTYLQRNKNEVSDVITGVTLSLRDAGSAVITVSADLNGVYGKIEALVNALNYAQEFIRTSTKYDPDGEDTGIMIGNYGYQIINSRLNSTMNESVAGLVDGTDLYTHLSQIGIKTDPDADGAWVIDSTALLAAMNEDLDAVANLFVYNEDNGSLGVAKRMYNESSTLTNSSTGMLNVLISNYQGIIKNIDDKIDFEEDRLELFRQRQVERFARLEATLSKLNGTSSSIEAAIAQLPSTSK